MTLPEDSHGRLVLREWMKFCKQISSSAEACKIDGKNLSPADVVAVARFVFITAYYIRMLNTIADTVQTSQSIRTCCFEQKKATKL
jgi:hypothetical protein